MLIRQFTHANTLQPVYIDLDLVVAWFYSPAGKATHILAAGGAMLPILESPEQVSERKSTAAKNALEMAVPHPKPTNGETKNG